MRKTKTLLFFIILHLIGLNELSAQDIFQSFEINSGSVAFDSFSFNIGDIFLELKNSEIIKTNKITVYPNPFIDKINIISNKQIENIAIYSLEGKLIYKENLPKHTLDLNYLNTGIYLLIINNETTFKIIKL